MSMFPFTKQAGVWRLVNRLRSPRPARAAMRTSCHISKKTSICSKWPGVVEHAETPVVWSKHLQWGKEESRSETAVTVWHSSPVGVSGDLHTIWPSGSPGPRPSLQSITFVLQLHQVLDQGHRWTHIIWEEGCRLLLQDTWSVLRLALRAGRVWVTSRKFSLCS